MLPHDRLRLGHLALGWAGYEILRSWATAASSATDAAQRMVEILNEMSEGGAMAMPIDVTSSDLVTGYGDWAGTYGRSANPIAELAHREAKALLGGIEHQQRGLDVGAGIGTVAAALRARCDQVIACDLVPEMLERARGISRIAPVLSVGECLPFASKTLDVVTACLVTGHFRTLDRFFLEAARVLRKGGVLLVVDVHPHATLTGAHPIYQRADGTFGVIGWQLHLVTDYLHSAARSGFDSGRVSEVLWPEDDSSMSLGLLGEAQPAVARPIIQRGEPAIVSFLARAR